MNEKYKEADELLKRIVYKNNDGYPMSVNKIYSILSSYGVDENQQGFNNKKAGFFNYWFFEYRTTNEVMENMTSLSITTINANQIGDKFKVFLPFDSFHIRISVKIIVDFLNSNNIKFKTKIDNRINCDGFYVLLTNSDDVKKLLNFVKGDIYIQQGLLKPNPFMFVDDNVACSSYTGLNETFVISKIINLYLNKGFSKNNNFGNELDKFLRFCTDYYNEVLSGSIDMDVFLSDMCEDDVFVNSGKVKQYKQIMELLIKSFQQNFSFKNYELICNNNSAIDNSKYNLSIPEKKKILDLILMKNFEVDDYKRISEGSRQNIKEREISSLYNMIKHGNFNLIYDQDYRELAYKTLTRKDVNKIVQNCYYWDGEIPIEELSDVEIENYARDYIENMYNKNRSKSL